MGKYEIMYILTATLDDEARKAEISKLAKVLDDNKIAVIDTKEWGLRDFAYPIKKQMKGYYVILTVNGSATNLNEFARLAKLDQNVVRFLITSANE
jgi:small subunit ribosomal protein S6